MDPELPAGVQAIGKINSDATPPCASPSGVMPTAGDINWVDFNYPPGFRLVHFDLDELPSMLSGIIWLFDVSFRLTVLACLINFFDTLVLVIATHAPAKWVLQSLLHLILLPVASLTVLYTGYRGLVEPDPTLAFRFKVAQPILGLTYFLLGILPFGCAHGLAELGHVASYTEEQGSDFWKVVIFVESTLWLGNAGVAVANTVRCHNFGDFRGGVLTSPSARF